MVIHDLNIDGTRFRPFETDPILVVDANAVLSFTVSGKRFQSISGRYAQFIEGQNGIQLIEFPEGCFPELPCA